LTSSAEAAAEEALAEEEAIESAEDDLVEDLEEADALQGVDEEELGEAAEEEELLGEESVVEEVCARPRWSDTRVVYTRVKCRAFKLSARSPLSGGLRVPI
jgi:hypothetical protein